MLWYVLRPCECDASWIPVVSYFCHLFVTCFSINTSVLGSEYLSRYLVYGQSHGFWNCLDWCYSCCKYVLCNHKSPSNCSLFCAWFIKSIPYCSLKSVWKLVKRCARFCICECLFDLIQEFCDLEFVIQQITWIFLKHIRCPMHAIQSRSFLPYFTVYPCCFVDELTWYVLNLGFRRGGSRCFMCFLLLVI